ncbi:Oidioi.mRNA.OKI2018_I69.PAR.g10465.t1.cds [Oikopleura dioica]|uniref:non-specific serine/threonine protein kinase n=1 Tax=Oikopleura dioica TaxID=34765 RepID=A0ABN7RUA9_OIKDI|nr:Oidioi.mRNA.OKI2018_I69.PAR.g10465.t1.cds [Oikopleura dioica]
MAPEMIKDAKYDTKADIWSLGCIIHELILLKRAYTSDSLMRLMYKIVEDPAPRISKNEVADLKLWPVVDILAKMLDKSAQSRPSAAQILQDSIFSESRASSATSRSSTGSRGSRPGSGKEMISMTSKPDFTETVKQLDTIKAKTFARHWSQTSDKQSSISSDKTPTASIDFALPEEIDEYASHLEATEYSDSESDSSDEESTSDEDDSEDDEIIREARLTLTDKINGSLYQEEKFERIDPSTDLASGVLTSKYERLKKQCIDMLGKVNFTNAYNFFRRMYELKEFPEDIISELGEIVGPLANHCMIVEELIMLEDQLRKN